MAENRSRLARDARKASKEGPDGIRRRQRARLAEAVTYARTHSPYYRELYKGLPELIEDPAPLPVTGKQELMARFDDWVTDRQVTLAKAHAFVDDPARVGDLFLDKYLVTTTSGTTGNMGVFLMDGRTRSVLTAMVSRVSAGMLTAGTIAKIARHAGRTATIAATGGHFGMYATAQRQLKESPWKGRLSRVFPVSTPLPRLVAQLNAYRPVIIEAYATVVALLASEQQAGRLRIAPAMISIGGEGLAEPEYDRIGQAFGAKVLNFYACNEAPAVSFTCADNWHHVHDDWVVFEPVDADHRPTPPGELSHTVLLSTLYKQEQPILRYDLGDSILLRPDPCSCGSPFTAFRVQGRAADILAFPGKHGERLEIVPLAFETMVERTGGIELFQVVQTGPDILRIRLITRDGSDPDQVWRRVHADLTGLLADHGLEHVLVERASEPPEQGTGGKYRTVIPLPRITRP